MNKSLFLLFLCFGLLSCSVFKGNQNPGAFALESTARFRQAPIFEELMQKAGNKYGSYNSITKDTLVALEVTNSSEQKHTTFILVTDVEEIHYMFEGTILTYIIVNKIMPSITFLGAEETFYVKTNFRYYASGKLRFKSGNLYNKHLNFVKAGTWEYYNEKGKLKHKVDHEKQFQSNTLDILMRAESFKDHWDYSPHLFRAFRGNKAYWKITSYYKYNSKPERHIIIDDRTGKIIYDNGTDDIEKTKIDEYMFTDYQKELYKLFTH